MEHGLLLTAALPPLAARGPAITIRRPRREAVRLGDLVGQGLLSQGMADFLELAVKARRNIVVSGPAAQRALDAAVGAGARRRRRRAHRLRRRGRGARSRRRAVDSARRRARRQGARRAQQCAAPQARAARSSGTCAAPRRSISSARSPAAATAASARCRRARRATRWRGLTAMARLAPEAPAAEALAEELTRGVHVLVHLDAHARGRSARGRDRRDDADGRAGGVQGRGWPLRADGPRAVVGRGGPAVDVPLMEPRQAVG